MSNQWSPTQKKYTTKVLVKEKKSYSVHFTWYKLFELTIEKSILILISKVPEMKWQQLRNVLLRAKNRFYCAINCKCNR